MAAEEVNTSKIVVAGVDNVSSVFSDIGTKVAASVGDLKTAFGSLREKAGEVVEKIGSVKDSLLGGLTGALGGVAGNIAGFVAGAGGELLTFFGDKFKEAIGQAASENEDLQKAISEVQTGFSDATGAFLEEFMPVLVELAQEVLPEITPLLTDFAKTAGSVLKEVVTVVKDNWPAMKQTISEVLTVVAALWKDPVQPALAALMLAIGNVVSWVKTNWPAIKTTFESVFLGIGTVIENGKLAIKSVSDAVDTFSRNWNTAWEGVKKFFDDTWSSITKFMDTLTGTFKKIGESVVGGFLGAFNGLGDLLKNLVLAPVKAIVQTIKDALLPIVDTPIVGGLAKAAIDALPKFAEGGILQAGRVGLVGERGPELVTFNRAARIIPLPQAQLVGGAGSTINVSVNVDSASSDIDIERMAYRIAEVIGQRI
jgi:phage-related protein